MEKRYLIVGGGLAGTLLARQLRSYGLQFLLVDDGRPSAASRVAAGLLNPIAGLRFNPPARVDEWLDSAYTTYSRLGAERGRPLLHKMPMYRLFRSPEQFRFYERRANDPRWRHLFGARFDSAQNTLRRPVQTPGFFAPFGGFEQAATGRLEIGTVLEHEREQLRLTDTLVEDRLDPMDLKRCGVTGRSVRWRGERFDGVIFCDGARGQFNPWFADLPWAPDKGELLTVQIDPTARPVRGPTESDFPHIINGAHWLLPLGEQRYRFGATHEHKSLDDAPTVAARHQLTCGLRDLLVEHENVTVIDQLAGVRPASADRLPFIGAHAQEPSMMIFNGFGARGGLSIPYYAQRMAAWLATGEPLPRECLPRKSRVESERGRSLLPRRVGNHLDASRKRY